MGIFSIERFKNISPTVLQGFDYLLSEYVRLDDIDKKYPPIIIPNVILSLLRPSLEPRLSRLRGYLEELTVGYLEPSRFLEHWYGHPEIRGKPLFK